MPFDTQTRNRLARLVTDARELITSEFAQQLQSVYGISESGEITPLSELKDLDEEQRALAEVLRDRLEYLKASCTDELNPAQVAVARFTREQAFTVLNRLAALRMAEQRGYILESVGHGYQSKGFQVYSQVAGSGLGDTYHRYRRYLFSLFDELAVDLRALFDRRSPTGLLFPGETALLTLFDLINAPGIEPLWAEDETIGWIYQYYNDEAERKRMREHAAPRDSRELAVRNQFFTPRYVVEFLVDNTLGRIWYESRQGDTVLKGMCRYLVRRPSELFLAKGESFPVGASTSKGPRNEDMLKHAVYIPYRAKKDPRDLKILDPACGSGHFLLYAFDLLEKIYEEAWKDKDQIPSDVTGRSIRADCPDLQGLQTAIPEFIIRYNLHGVDIDLRACQIAGLALWLRAQSTYQRQNLKPDQRPTITRSNIVCAEPMPGERSLLDDFVADLQPKVLGHLVQVVFEKMKLAGEAGTLLKIEQEIAGAVAEGKRLWLAGSKAEQTRLFGEGENAEHRHLGLDLSGITDEAFWDRADDEIYAALQTYAEQAETSHGYQRRLFASDTARGFALIDLCRRRYDVILMNPPFGEPAQFSQPYLREHYPDDRNEIMACFLTRSQGLANSSAILGVISSRTVFFNTFCEAARKQFFFGGSKLSALIDLGWRVLDGAAVEAAAYCAHVGSVASAPIAIRALRDHDRAACILQRITELRSGERWPAEVFLTDLSSLGKLPHSPLAYWMSSSFLAACRQHHSLAQDNINASVGLSSADNFRHLRLAWEVNPVHIGTIGSQQHWVPLVKGGEYNPMYDDVHLLLNWYRDGYELLNSSAATIRNAQFYGISGLTYPYRTASGFCLRILPKGCAFSDGGHGLIASGFRGPRLLQLAAYCHGRVPRAVLEVFLGEGGATSAEGAARNYVPRAVEEIPLPSSLDLVKEELALEWAIHMRRPFLHDETAREFCCPPLVMSEGRVREGAKTYVQGHEVESAQILTKLGNLDKAVTRDFELTATDIDFLDEEFGELVSDFPRNGTVDRSKALELYKLDKDELTRAAMETVGARRFTAKKMYWVSRRIELMSRVLSVHPASIVQTLVKESPSNPSDVMEIALCLVSWLVGAAFGRWDIRYLTEGKLTKEFEDPFSELPPCSPGTLRNDAGLPLMKEDVDDLMSSGLWTYPVDIPWSGILSDDPGHRFDLTHRVEKLIDMIWSQKADGFRQEICEILGANSIADYLRKPASYFADHLMRYSKSRRQAPIYWPISTTSGRYTLWLYYPRLTTQTLHQCIADFVQPKLKSVSAEIQQLHTSNAAQARLEELLDLKEELNDMQAEIERIIQLPYAPNQNDGVVITACPLWKLFRLPKWQKDLKTCWEELEQGDYDWSHLAFSIWPDRVRIKCKTDRSFAIAHNLEQLCQLEQTKLKSKKSRAKQTSFVGENVE
jgi:hypothetical protein